MFLNQSSKNCHKKILFAFRNRIFKLQTLPEQVETLELKTLQNTAPSTPTEVYLPKPLHFSETESHKNNIHQSPNSQAKLIAVGSRDSPDSLTLTIFRAG
ncbi:hypothetical protein THIOM_001517 [Candidatus Thiomargarita nelsonii]|uniref:Uncharacterized protein n=1 Tax=Candidatus Thiomargarita nelsonii TaxID=1003181 RepID=A0A176S456_9GAMM|nr:hypothetical protein THIOM_001517 [Candidatus Thiomargarita nelsonii]